MERIRVCKKGIFHKKMQKNRIRWERVVNLSVVHRLSVITMEGSDVHFVLFLSRRIPIQLVRSYSNSHILFVYSKIHNNSFQQLLRRLYYWELLLLTLILYHAMSIFASDYTFTGNCYLIKKGFTFTKVVCYNLIC